VRHAASSNSAFTMSVTIGSYYETVCCFTSLNFYRFESPFGLSQSSCSVRFPSEATGTV